MTPPRSGRTHPNRKSFSWASALTRIFGSPRMRRAGTRLRLEQLCDRVVPATWNVMVTNDEFDANPQNDLSDLSLREAIYLANQDVGATQTINLVGGSTYALNTAQGDLDIVDQGGVAATKTYLIVASTAGGSAVIDQTIIDRVFHIIGADSADLAVTFQNVTIQGGTATDDGSDGATGGTALGGGVLNQGGGGLAFIDPSSRQHRGFGPRTDGATVAVCSPGRDKHDVRTHWRRHLLQR